MDERSGGAPSVGIIVTDVKLSELVRQALGAASIERVDPPRVLVVELTGKPDCKAASATRRIREAHPDVFVVAVSSEHTTLVTQQAVRLRVDDFFHLPNELRDFQTTVIARIDGNASPDKRCGRTPVLKGASAQMVSLRGYIERVALADSSVLITGETGTGKELVAETLHRQGARRAGPFVSVNSAALPEPLFESEMFGYERGAFSGAHARYAGKLRMAHRGTIFFDEIGDIGLSAQAKVLRALETREVVPIGGTRACSVDVRVVAATNRDLEGMMKEGAFRADLFYRLNVVRIEIPPLRERPEDIPELVSHFVEYFSAQFGRNARFEGDAVALLAAHDFPGNVRELKNIVESAFVNSRSDVMTALDLPQSLRRGCDKRTVLDERRGLLGALVATNWNISRAASQLRCSRMTIYRKIAEYKIMRPDGSSFEESGRLGGCAPAGTVSRDSRCDNE